MEKNIRHGKCDLANDSCCVRVEVVSGRSVTSTASLWTILLTSKILRIFTAEDESVQLWSQETARCDIF